MNIILSREGAIFGPAMTSVAITLPPALGHDNTSLYVTYSKCLACHAVMNAIVSAGRQQTEVAGCLCYYTKNKLCPDCEEMISLSGMTKK